MQTITTIGLDIAKSVFQVHGVDNDGKVVIRRQLKRRYVLAFFEKLCSPACQHRGLCLVTPLVTRAAGTWPYRTVDADLFSVRPSLPRRRSKIVHKRELDFSI